MTSFEQSVIIPLENYKKYKDFISKINEVPSSKILMDKNLPADIKMKLFKKQRFKDKLHKVPLKTTITDNKTSSTNVQTSSQVDKISSSVQTIPQLPNIDRTIFHNDDKKTIDAILNTIASNVHELSYNKDYEILIDRRVLPTSNIKEILNYILNRSILTKSSDVPLGALHFYEKLLKLGFPQALIKFKPSVYATSEKIRSEAMQFVTPKTTPIKEHNPAQRWFPYNKTPRLNRKSPGSFIAASPLRSSPVLYQNYGQ